MIETYNSSYEDKQIVIPSFTKKVGEKAYFYSNQNEKVYGVRIQDYEMLDGDLYFPCSNEELCAKGEKMSGHIDVIVGQESLLKHIFD